MLNLTEKHVVVVIVLIAVIFLLFLSTRTPICTRESFIENNLKSNSILCGDDSANLERNYQSDNEIKSSQSNKKLKKKSKLENTKIIQQYKENNYSEVNNDLFMDKNEHTPINIDNDKNIKHDKNKPLLLTKSDMKDLKGLYDSEVSVNDANDEVLINEFDNSYENLHYKKITYATISENEIDESIETKIEDVSNKITLSENDNLSPLLDDTPLLNDKPFNYGNNCSDDVDVPEGRDVTYNFSPFGLLREQSKSFYQEHNKRQLDEDKCSVLRDAVLDLNKTGVIKNNNVEDSWNNTFKDTCGNW